ncbi:MAG TPA: alpha/beta fold hydrolase [Opitutus sp.]|nr:alpha/beta fold hydrolase [Opitutus sp.]
MFHIVENDERHRSLWPDFRRQALPRGWRFTGFSGSREACLRQIAAGDAVPAPPPPAVSASVPVAAPPALRRRAIAVPFAKPHADLRLFVFPHAGSGASAYHFLARACKNDPVEVNLIQYPGREMRLREPPCEDMDAMVASLDDDLRDLLAGRPFAFFGHSMGSLVAFELTRRLAAAGRPLPQQLFLSGRQAPQCPALNLPVDSMSDAEFLDAVGRRYNALPAELMSNPEILSLLLPSLRADFKLMAGHRHRPAAPLGVKLTLLNGVDDPWVNQESIAAWQAQSELPIESHWLPGGHFYLPEAIATVRDVMLRALGLEETAR